AGDVGMILLGQVAKHPVDRVLVRVRTELEELVVVDEQLSAHVPTPEIVVGRIGPELEPSTGGTSYHTVPGIVSANGQAHRIPVIRLSPPQRGPAPADFSLAACTGGPPVGLHTARSR